MASQMIDSMKSLRVEIPQKVFDIIEEEIVTVMTTAMGKKGGLTDQLIKVYNKHYSHQK